MKLSKVPLLLAGMCFVVCGCGENLGEENAKYYWGKWESERTISIVDDSLAVVAINKYYIKEWRECGWLCRDMDEIIYSNLGLFLVNYRVKQKPLLGDTLENALYDDSELRIVEGYFKDSSVLIFDRNGNRFGLWKIGEKSIKFNESTSLKNNKYKGYSSYESRARPWLNGNIMLFLRDYDSYSSWKNTFVLLDTKSWQILPFEFSEENEWLHECGDISYIGEKITCLRKSSDDDNVFELVVDDAVTNTNGLIRSYGRDRELNYYGNYYISSGPVVYKINAENFKFDNTYTPLSATVTAGFSNSGNFVQYNVKDLIGVN